MAKITDYPITSSLIGGYVLGVDSLGNVTRYQAPAGLGAGDVIAANNGSEFPSKATLRLNIGLAIGTDVQAYNVNLTAWQAKTVPTGVVVGTTDTQTLTNKTLTSPAITTPTGIVKGDVGLGNVDNTSDANKPVSTAQAAADALKANIASPTFTGTVGGITKSMVGLGNVDNTSDAAKPISTLTQAALDAKQPLDSDLTAIAALSTTSYGRSLLAAADAAGLRTLAGAVIGTDVQAYDAELAALAGLTSAADRLPYFTGSGTASLATFTTAGRALVDDADAAAQRTTLGLGTAATVNTGTSGATIPYLDGVNTWSKAQNFSQNVTVAGAVGVPAGGSSSAVMLMSSTFSNFGIYFGSGAPTITAGQGSLYLRTDGNSTSTRLYVNNNGSTGWSNVTTNV